MKFVARISREGVIIIPRRLHDKVETLEGLDLLVTLQPIVVETDDAAASEAAAVEDIPPEECGCHGCRKIVAETKSMPFKEWRDNTKPAPSEAPAAEDLNKKWSKVY